VVFPLFPNPKGRKRSCSYLVLLQSDVDTVLNSNREELKKLQAKQWREKEASTRVELTPAFVSEVSVGKKVV
jgi:hypothetical protein